MKFRPLDDRIVIERIEAEAKTAGARRSRSRAGSLPLGQAAVDESGKLIPIDVKVGDRILFGKWSEPRSRSMGSST